MRSHKPHKSILTKARAWSAGLLALLLVGGIAPAFATQTPAGTTITNTATANYTDNNGNAITATSNTVTTIVQNAPSLTNTNSGNQTVAPNAAVTQTYTLTNTGNNAGDFQLTAATVSGGSAAIVSSNGYIVTLPSGSPQTFSTLAAANTYLAANTVASGAAATVQIVYNVGATTAGTTIAGTLSATLAYVATGSANAATSATATSNETDTVANDARLDVAKSASQNSTTGNITYTLKMNNGGAFTAHYVQALSNASFGFGSLTTTGTVGGILIADKIPTYTAGVNPTLVAGSPVVAFTRGTNGFPSDSSETATVVCSTSTTGASGWSTTCNSSSVWIGVLISGGSLSNSVSGGDGLLSNPAGSAATGGLGGGPNVTAAAVTLSFTITPPSGNGSANAGAITNVANGVFTNNNATPQIVGPGGTVTDGTGAGPAASTVTDIDNTTGNTGSGPSGASQPIAGAALSAYLVLVGPFGSPGALGDYANTGTATNTGDFTDYAFQDGTSPPTTTSTNPSSITGNTTAAAVSFCVANTVQNAGNLTDNSITLAVTAPASPSGWTVQLESNNTCTSPLNGATSGATSTTATPLSLTSGSSLNFYVKYTAPIGTSAFTAYDSAITATGSLNGVTPNTNTTHNELYDGFIALTKVATVTSNGCPTGVTVQAVCPGGVIQYQVYVQNVAKGNTGTGATEPATALLNSTAGTLVIADDGTASGSWFAGIPSTSTFVTSGLNAVPALTVGGVSNTASVCTYLYGSPAGSSSTTFTAPVYTVGSLANGPSKFSCVLGGATFALSPGVQSILTFSVTVRAN
jgi:hypothetical protein